MVIEPKQFPTTFKTENRRNRVSPFHGGFMRQLNQVDLIFVTERRKFIETFASVQNNQIQTRMYHHNHMQNTLIHPMRSSEIHNFQS